MITGNYIVVDIETTKSNDAHEFAKNIIPPSNYKDEKKIAEYIADKTAEWENKTALSPLTGRICAIGTLLEYGGELPIQNIEYDIDGSSEQKLLKSFWKTISTHNGYIIGHNIKGFDLPYLILRSLKYNITPSFYPNRNNYSQVIDTMDLWNMNRYPKDYISLDMFARFLGVGMKTGSGEMFFDTLKTDEESALKYLANDLHLTNNVFKKFIYLL